MLVIGLAGAALILLVWYFYFLRSNRRRAMRALAWVGEVFAGHGEIIGVQPRSASEFFIRLSVSNTLFRQARVRGRIHPRPLPALWLWSYLKKIPETLTFEADFAFAPCFSLEVYNRRWGGWIKRSKKDIQKASFHHVTPFLLTTRTDWQREIMSMMTALVASKNCNFLSVRFRPESPHFSASVLMNTASFGSQCASKIFDLLRELASCASTSRF